MKEEEKKGRNRQHNHNNWSNKGKEKSNHFPDCKYYQKTSYLLRLGFKRSVDEVTLYVKNVDKHILIILVYVDDLLIAANKEQLVIEFINNMKDVFEMNELGQLTYFLVMG